MELNAEVIAHGLRRLPKHVALAFLKDGETGFKRFRKCGEDMAVFTAELEAGRYLPDIAPPSAVEE